MKRLILIGLLLICPSSFGAINCDFTTLQNAITAAARNATITCNAGTWDWSANSLSVTKGLTLVGAGVGITNIGGAGGGAYSSVITIEPDITAINNDETIKITGFTFDCQSSATSIRCINLRVDSNTPHKAFNNFLFGHNKIQNATVDALRVLGQLRGAIYSNTFDRAQYPLRVFGLDSIANEWNGGYFPFSFGSSNLYFEANTISYSSSFNNIDSPGWIEIGQGGRVVVRFNTWNMTNALLTNDYLDIHGFQGWNGTLNGGQTGTMLTEYYRNTFSAGRGSQWINHRGSQLMAFDNTFTSPTSGVGPMAVNDYYWLTAVVNTSGTAVSRVSGDIFLPSMTDTTMGVNPAVLTINGVDYLGHLASVTDANNLVLDVSAGTQSSVTLVYHYNGGSGCAAQINPTLTSATPEVNNTYVFNNIFDGSRVSMAAGVVGNGCGVAENSATKGYFNQQDAFDGTVGVGRGLSASKPATCTQGVGYWATDEGSWNLSGSGGQGVLYKCTSTNTWTLYYTPYTYPYPGTEDATGNAGKLRMRKGQ